MANLKYEHLLRNRQCPICGMYSHGLKVVETPLAHPYDINVVCIGCGSSFSREAWEQKCYFETILRVL